MYRSGHQRAPSSCLGVVKADWHPKVLDLIRIRSYSLGLYIRPKKIIGVIQGAELEKRD